MLMSNRQRRGFMRLFQSLTLYVAKEAHLPEVMAGDTLYRQERKVMDAVEAIWDTDDGTTWIDRFLADNPYHLNRRDQDIVASWKNAIAADFCITRVGADALFCTEEYAFAVRGFDVEVYDAVEVPALCWVVLLPYDGVITFAGGLAFAKDAKMSMRGLAHRGPSWYRERGHLIRTERQFLREAAAISDALAAPKESSAAEEDPHALVAGQHKGVLAGIWGDERTRLALDQIYARMGNDSPFDSVVRSHVVSRCEADTPAGSLEELFMRKKRDEIVEWARWMNMVRYSSLRKAELAHWVAHFLLEDPTFFSEIMQQLGKLCVEGVWRTYQAGGRLEVSVSAIEKFTDFPEPCFPLLEGYRMGDTLVAHITDDVMEALAKLDWDAELEQARRIYRAERYLETAVSFRGLVPTGDLKTLLEEDAGVSDFTTDEYRAMMFHLDGNELISVDFLDVAGEAGEPSTTYAFDPIMRELQRDNGNSASTRPEFRPKEILDAQQGIRPRPVGHMPDAADAIRFITDPDTSPVAKEIIAFLDEHVPDGGDDYNFAERILENTVVAGWQRDFTVFRVKAALADEGFVGTPAQIRHVEELFRRLWDDMPRWRHNGWSDATVDANRL